MDDLTVTVNNGSFTNLPDWDTRENLIRYEDEFKWRWKPVGNGKVTVKCTNLDGKTDAEVVNQ